MYESDTDRSKEWKLKKINKCWFLDVGGKLTRMNMLNNATDVHMEDNIIFADDLVFQLTEESDKEITVSEIKDICQKDKTSEYESTETYVKCKRKESCARNNADKKESEHLLQKEDDRNEDMAQDTPLTHQNRSSRAELKLVDDPDDGIYGDSIYGDDEEMNYELGSENYTPKKGVFRGLFKRLKQIVKKKPGVKQIEEPLYEDIIFNEVVSQASTEHTLQDFSDYSEGEEELREEALRDFTDNCDGSKGDIPLAYNKENINALDKENTDALDKENTDALDKENTDALDKENIVGLNKQSWWFDLSREEAIDLLQGPGNGPGTYLVRPSQSFSGLSLSMVDADKRVIHYLIVSENRRLYVIPGRSFNDIFELIEYYQCTAGGLRCKLENPAKKQNYFANPPNLEVESGSVDLTKSLRSGEFFTGKFSNTLDVTIVTNFKLRFDEFLAETNGLHNLRECKCFVRVLAVITNPEPFMIILGETVRSTLLQYLRIDSGKTLTFKTLLEMAAEIAEGMAFLEKQNVVHRHLKAANVFVCDFDQPKIVHPKLSEMMKDRSSDEHCNDENEWQWTAPEATDDEPMFSTKSDVWSFGILLYELITFGNVPYAGLIEKDTLKRLHEGFRLSKPKDGPVSCPVALYATMFKCWHRLPDSRPTFDCLKEFFHDFEVAIECEKGTEETELDPQKSEPQESTPVTSESLQSVGITEPTAENNNDEKLQVTSGIIVKALYDYYEEDDDEISFYEDDIVTDVDTTHEGWWIGTTVNGARGMFPSNYVMIFRSAYAEVDKL